MNSTKQESTKQEKPNGERLILNSMPDSEMKTENLSDVG